MTNRYRSKFEADFAARLNKSDVLFKFEKSKIQYTKPATQHKYTPDFEIAPNVFVETKGRWVHADRLKQELVRAQHPNIRIILIFMNPKVTISKTSKTTYADYCNKRGWEWYTATEFFKTVAVAFT